MGGKTTVGRTEQAGRELQKFSSSEGGQKYRQGVEENKITETANLTDFRGFLGDVKKSKKTGF